VVVRDTPEEYVRQILEKALVRRYRYDPLDCEPEFPIKVEASRRRVDVTVSTCNVVGRVIGPYRRFHPGNVGRPHD
jgi:hypothetical protein